MAIESLIQNPRNQIIFQLPWLAPHSPNKGHDTILLYKIHRRQPTQYPDHNSTNSPSKSGDSFRSNKIRTTSTIESEASSPRTGSGPGSRHGNIHPRPLSSRPTDKPESNRNKNKPIKSQKFGPIRKTRTARAREGRGTTQSVKKKPRSLSDRTAIKPITSLCRFTTASRFFFKLRTGVRGGGRVRSREALGSDIVRRPIVWPAKDLVGDPVEGEASGGVAKADLSGGGSEDSEEEVQEEEEEEWVDWGDEILEDTLPLVGLVRMILHSGR